MMGFELKLNMSVVANVFFYFYKCAYLVNLSLDKAYDEEVA